MVSGSGCVAQLIERLPPIPEVRGSNPVISKKIIYIEHLFTVNCVLKRWKKEKEAGNGPFLKNDGIYGHNGLKNLSMSEFELRISGVGSDRFTNWATTTAQVADDFSYENKETDPPSYQWINPVVVAQLAERSLQTPKVCSSNPVVGNFYWTEVC